MVTAMSTGKQGAGVNMAAARFYSMAKGSALSRQAGFGMAEVLVALIISAFALLGLAGLQVSSLRYQKVAGFRATATQYAAEMSDRMRANVVGARNGSYNLAASNYTTHEPDAPGATPCDGSAPAACTPAQLALFDIYNWRLGLNRGMAGGWGEVSGDVNNGFIIRVYFKEPGNQSESLDPNCRAGALGGGDNNDVRCFVTVFYP
jgi:type IV pilus assembly protein PilV